MEASMHLQTVFVQRIWFLGFLCTGVFYCYSDTISILKKTIFFTAWLLNYTDGERCYGKGRKEEEETGEEEGERSTKVKPYFCCCCCMSIHLGKLDSEVPGQYILESSPHLPFSHRFQPVTDTCIGNPAQSTTQLTIKAKCCLSMDVIGIHKRALEFP